MSLGSVTFAFKEKGEENKVSVPLTLKSGENVRIGSITAEIIFPNKDLTFLEVKIGPLVKATDGVITSDVRVDPKEPEKSILKLLISVSKNSAAKAIPAGLLSELVFKVSDTAKDGTLKLPIRVSALDTDTPLKAVEVDVSEGSITIEEVPIFGCFFYMH